MLKIDDMDEAIVGVVSNWLPKPRLVYDGIKIVELLMASGMTDIDALEYCSFNIEGAYMGDDTPLIVWPYEDEEP